jgi:hypothetical protein
MDEFAVNLLLNLKSTEIQKTINIIIFDWDDTLFPSEYFKTRINMLQNHNLIPKNIKLELRTLASNIIKVITNAKSYGNVTIISNASMKWLQLCFDIVPEIIPILRTINIVSAQDNFKHQSSDPAKWKEWTFYHYISYLIKGYDQQDNIKYDYNIISIGDSIHERDALKKITNYLKEKNQYSIFAKTIKLVETPTFEKVINQLQILFHIFYEIENISNLQDEDYNFS